MATEVVTKTFIDILNSVVQRGKIAPSFTEAAENTQEILKRFVNDRYTEIAFSKKWPWREETRVIITSPKYTTGTASVTNGQKEVDLSTAIDSTYEGRFFRVNTDGEYYEIISVTDAANGIFLLNAPYKGTTNATASFTIFRNTYGLFPDYADIIEITPFGLNSIYGPRPLDEVGSEEMSRLQAAHPLNETQYPSHYTIQDNQNYDGPAMGPNFVMGYDFMGEGPSTPSLVFFPSILSQSAIQIKYGIQVTPLVENTDQPLIPFEKRKVLVYGALADWFSLQGNLEMLKIYEHKYDDMLSKMKSDFDKSEVRMTLRATRGRRRVSKYPATYPSIE